MPQRKSLMTPAQCRAGRALLELSQATLAEIAELGVSTVADFELERRSVSPEASYRLQAALEASGVQFTNGKHPGVRLAR
jgi:transcriptional regulator with XRE-family HTH domain